MRSSWIIGIVVVIIIIVGGWLLLSGGNAPSQQTSESTSSSDQTQNSGTPSGAGQAGVLVLNTGTSSTLGTYLVAANGMTLYKYNNDTSGVSNCTGQCAANWPPYTVTSADNLAAATGITGQVSTITRADGSLQVTYNGMPLYFWKNDSKPGDTTGQGVGGVWYVVQP